MIGLFSPFFLLITLMMVNTVQASPKPTPIPIRLDASPACVPLYVSASTATVNPINGAVGDNCSPMNSNSGIALCCPANYTVSSFYLQNGTQLPACEFAAFSGELSESSGSTGMEPCKEEDKDLPFANEAGYGTYGENQTVIQIGYCATVLTNFTTSRYSITIAPSQSQQFSITDLKTEIKMTNGPNVTAYFGGQTTTFSTTPITPLNYCSQTGILPDSSIPTSIDYTFYASDYSTNPSGGDSSNKNRNGGRKLSFPITLSCTILVAIIFGAAIAL